MWGLGFSSFLLAILLLSTLYASRESRARELPRKCGRPIKSIGDVWLSPLTSATPLECCNPQKIWGTHARLPVTYWRKVGITSSRHDPYELGYTRVTMAFTKGSNGANRSESLKTVSVRIVLCNSRASSWNH